MPADIAVDFAADPRGARALLQRARARHLAIPWAKLEPGTLTREVRLLSTFCCLASVLLWSGCVSSRRALEVEAPTRPSAQVDPVGLQSPSEQTRQGDGRSDITVATGSESAPELWGIPPSELGTQRIVRLSYQDRERDGSLKLVLRLATADRFSLQGSDQFGRSWFRIAVADGAALVLDLREKSYCLYQDAIELEELPLGPLAFDALPALLLGRLPVAPGSWLAEADDSWSYRDDQGRRWTARVEDGALVSWILWQEGEPEVFWQQEGKMSLLSSRRQQLQMRWRVGRTEALASDPDGTEPPSGFFLRCPGNSEPTP